MMEYKVAKEKRKAAWFELQTKNMDAAILLQDMEAVKKILASTQNIPETDD